MFDARILMKEEDFSEHCSYCGEKLNKSEWETVHYSHAWYKVMDCSCGKENKVTLDFKNTAHAKWIEEEILHLHKRKQQITARIEPVKHKQHPSLEEKVEKK